MFLWLRRLALHFIINFAALYAAAHFLTGIEIAAEGAQIWEALAIASLVFSVVNTMLKPILSFFSVPFIILTLGLFMLVINGLMLELTAFLVPDFIIESFTAALKGALLITLVHYSAHWLMRETFKA